MEECAVPEKYDALVTRLKQIEDLNAAASLLNWDLEVMMPEGGSGARARQLSTLSRVLHDMRTSDETGRMLEEAEKELAGADYDSDEASMLRIARYDFDQQTKLPTDFVAEFTQLTAEAHDVWAKARADSNFRLFEPALSKITEMVMRSTEYLGYKEHPYDALIDQFERGMTAAEVKRIFDSHKPALIDLIAQVGKVHDRVSNEAVHQDFDTDKQREFALSVVKKYGFDFTRGRQDVSVHPFCTNFSRNDVRMTTRFHNDFLNPALFGLMHESGHGMYEQGSPEAYDGTPLAGGTSLGVHESQSRLWENIVGRSRPFWKWAYPQLQATFPQLGGTDLDTFYRAINTVQRQFIRVEADEATYNLHIMLRFELECDLVAGKVKVADLPEEWNDRFEAYLGVTPPNDRMGVLQDVHWSFGGIGYFPTYALGNLLSVQYYDTALRAHPSIPDEIGEGKFDTLFNWLSQNIYQYGRKYTSQELTQPITGGPIDPAPYVAYLQKKYSDVYGI
ncbi:MAG: carboxypeptidase M32 [Chloroflexi bacterium]|nr:carboxypeptidase M32 [Chloroflexota bacterium]